MMAVVMGREDLKIAGLGQVLVRRWAAYSALVSADLQISV
jgi:hypothetical protein